MISNKDLYLEEYYRSGVATEMAMRQEYEAWQAWEALMTWADDRIRQSEQFFFDLRQENFQSIALAPEDTYTSNEYRWFMAGESQVEGREIPFLTQTPEWRIPA